jgi:hypothetical protein
MHRAKAEQRPQQKQSSSPQQERLKKNFRRGLSSEAIDQRLQHKHSSFIRSNRAAFSAQAVEL